MQHKYLYNSVRTASFLLPRINKILPLGFLTRKLAFPLFAFLFVPATVAYAGFFSFFEEFFAKQTVVVERPVNSQNMNLLQADNAPDGEKGRGGADVSVVGGTALFADAGPSGALPDADEIDEGHGEINIYEVREGDSFASIAKLYDVSVNTIIWANNLDRKSVLKVGQTLVILPVSGVSHTVKKGDTIEKIAKLYKGDIDEVRDYNGIEPDQVLAVGSVVIVPDGEVQAPVIAKKPATSKLRGSSAPAISGYFASPLDQYKKTQGLHGYNGVDLVSYVGAPVRAAAAGEVIVARQGGYNGGYGNYVVIRHANGTQTLYAHLLSTSVIAGERVAQGQNVGALGNTGRSTGPHLHFEVRGAKNPF